jgi:hypothetical protein
VKRWLHVAVPVLLGGLVYCSFRSTDHLLFRWLDALHLTPAVDHLRRVAASWRPQSTWALYSLPDGLWLYGFCCAMRSLWRARGEGLLWRGAPLALALGSEAAQGLGLLQGTFDPADVATYLVAFGLARVTT